MYTFADDGDVAENYQRSVRDRANQSLHELDEVLAGTSPSASLKWTGRAKEQLAAAVHPRTLKYYETDTRPKKYKDAVSQLESLLHSGYQAPVPAAPGDSRGPLPTAEEAAAVLYSQTTYIQHLEGENRYIKDEMSIIKAKITEIIEENRHLHEALKTSVYQEILNEDENFFKTAGSADGGPMSVKDFKQWQVELERLSALHTAKTERLEAQLTHTRSEIQKYEQMVEDLRRQLRMRDAIPTREDGGFADVMLSETQRSFHIQTTERLTKERDELMDHVTSLKSRLQEMVHREEEAYQQVKKGVELVEQAQLEQTQACIQKEQLSEELNNMRQRFDAHIMSTQHRMQEDRDVVRHENKVVVEELNTKFKELLENHMAVQNEMEKMAREKVSLQKELEDTKSDLRRYSKEASMASENFRAENTNATMQKSHAVHETTRLRKELDTTQRDRDRERSCMQAELDDLRRRLNKAERDLVNSKEECIQMTSNGQALERELHLAKLARDGVERGRNDDLKALTKRAQMREDELNHVVEELEEQHSHTTSEMDDMLKKQNRLISKLKDECRRQAGQLDRFAKKNRKECGQLKRENEELKLRLDRGTTRLQDLEEQAEQHSRIHEKMKERLKMMDDHAQHQGQQLLELMARQCGILRDRQLLAREVEFLRKQISRDNDEELNKFFSSNKGLVDEILSNMTEEDRDKKGSVITDGREKISIDDLIYS